MLYPAPGQPPGKSGTPYSCSNGVDGASSSPFDFSAERLGKRRVGTEEDEEEAEREKSDVGDKSQDISLVSLCFGALSCA
jgi:hypothetical protein